jgi:hypothetical protein
MIQQLPDERTLLPEPVLHIHLLLLQVAEAKSEPSPLCPTQALSTPTCSREKAVTRVRQPLFSSSFHSASQ